MYIKKIISKYIIYKNLSYFGFTLLRNQESLSLEKLLVLLNLISKFILDDRL